MAITVFVENMNHDRVRWYQDEGGGLAELVGLGKASRSALAAVYRHGDAMLNTPQLWWLLDEVEGFGADEIPRHVRTAREALVEAANEAIRLRGYLFFSGD